MATTKAKTTTATTKPKAPAKPKVTVTAAHAADIQLIADKMAALSAQHGFCDVFTKGVKALNAKLATPLKATIKKGVRVSAWIEREFEIDDVNIFALRTSLKAEYAKALGLKPTDISVSF